MYQISSEIIIKANSKTVWSILTDFANYPNWNPFIKYIHGEPKVGNILEAKLQPKNTSGMVYKPKVLAYEENKEFRWLGHTYFPGLFDGEHIFQLESMNNNEVKFIQTEKFTGILTPLFKSFLDNNTLASFKEMNETLKTLAEKSTN